MLSGGWKESIVSLGEYNSTANNQQKEKNDNEMRLRYEIGATEWDAEVFLLLMNIIHGRHRKVPSSIDIETLGRLSVLVDYYECHEITEFFVQLWIDGLTWALPTSYGQDSTIWLCVSWILSNASIFEKMTELAMKESYSPLETMCLPLPPTLLCMEPHLHAKDELTLRDSRYRAKTDGLITSNFQTLGELRDGFVKGSRGCGYECSCMLLGSLIKEMSKHGLEHDNFLESFSGRSIKRVKSIVLGFQTPVWYSDRYNHRYSDRYSPPHRCSLSSMLRPAMDNVWEDLKGLRLDDYRAC